VNVYGVQPRNACIMGRGPGGFEPRPRGADTTIADGLDVGVPSAANLKVMSRTVDDVTMVSEEEIASSVLLLLERAKTLVEGAGACSLAAALSGELDLKGRKVACLITGGNIDVLLLDTIINRGLARAGRFLSITTIIPDRPGELARLAGVIANARANIYSVDHDRLSPGVDVQGAVVELELETRGHQHSHDVVEALRQAGYQVRMR